MRLNTGSWARCVEGTGVDDLIELSRLVEALRPWLDELVLVGGWAHRLYRLRPELAGLPYQALRTRDADLAFSTAAPLAGNIGHALRSAGFREEFRGDDSPPVTRYHLGQDDGFYAEFLTPLRGGGPGRGRSRDLTVSRAGIVAQKLRHLDLLLISPWTVRLTGDSGVPMNPPADIRIANPVSFITQKILIRNRRAPGKQAQDILYIHDTLDLFGGNLQVLRSRWVRDVRPQLSSARVGEFEQLRTEQFAEITDQIRDAALIPQDRRLEPEEVRAACALGLTAIFG